jgi:alpha-beta hydrolase superfamily lysophospholipase
MGRSVRFQSDGLSLAGIIETPPGLKSGERRPAFLVLHGFGSNKSSSNVKLPMQMLNALGYVTMGFDMRGCGDSEGERGNLICLEQVRDTSSAVRFIREQPEVMPDKVALVGSSFGGAVAVYTGGVDTNVAAVISSGGWGNGERKFRGQHTTPEAWKKFTDMLAKGKGYREKHGKPLMVPRYDIVPIPQHLRNNLAANSIHEFTWETAQSMFEFRADDVVVQMAPRPLLLLHSSVDSVTPTKQSVELFKRAGQPCDLHLFAETDHFMFAEENTRVHAVVTQWLERFFPAR